jgi:cytochrome P450
MSISDRRIPPGPTERFDSSDDLLQWIVAHHQQYGDIYRASVYGSNVYVISAPEYFEHVLLRNWQNYARKGQMVKRISLLLGNGLIASNGEFWVNQRRMIQPAFSRKSVSALMPIVIDANSELLVKWKRAALGNSSVNVTRDVSDLVLKITLQSIFGEDYEAVAPFFNVLAEESARDLQFAQAFQPLGKEILKIAERRRQKSTPGADILGALLQARDRDRGQPMSDVQLAKEAKTLIVAGHETTSTALNWVWYLLSKYPSVEAKLARELAGLRGAKIPTLDSLRKISYCCNVIEEALRLYPPAWLVTRHALKDDRLGDFFVPAGTEIYISPYLIQRNPGFWEEPAEFDPDRFEAESSPDRPRLSTCPFGAGPRNCIGELLARTEMQIHLVTMVPELRFRNDESRPPELVAGMNLLSKHDFMMTPELRPVAAAPTIA